MGTEKSSLLKLSNSCFRVSITCFRRWSWRRSHRSCYTYTASCSVIEHVGATPVMVDIQEDHFEMNYDALAEAITEKKKSGYSC